MPVFQSRDQAAAVFGRLFEIMLEDEVFVARVRQDELSLRLVHTDPDLVLHVDGSGVRVDGDVPEHAAIAIKMSCDTADALWSGRVLMPIAVATRRIRIRGSVAKVLEFVPLLQPAFARYPEIARAAGVAA